MDLSALCFHYIARSAVSFAGTRVRIKETKESKNYIIGGHSAR